ncbi:MAG TPA: exopolyphosphatase [Bacteroidia bacterium]|nr:exopolyphosphatase [Bacteroidia bacterium]
MKFASIDIGSNAVRLLFCNVLVDKGKASFKKSELIRIPLRLGEDAFVRKRITQQKVNRLVTTMKAFKHLISVHDVIDYKACATAALRAAENREDILRRIRREAGINVEIIAGKTEASIIYANHAEEHLDKNSSYLYIDIGGGSTELTLIHKGKSVASRSFNIGTILLLYNKVDKESWLAFKQWVRDTTANKTLVTAIGSGGNINKLYKMSDKKGNRPLPYKKLKTLAAMIESYSPNDRVKVLGLNPDRADVIVPAAKILLTIMKNAKIQNIIVPEIGLSDGIVRGLYSKYKKGK